MEFRMRPIKFSAARGGGSGDDEGDFGSSADKFGGGTPDVQVAWLLGPIAESGNVSDFKSLLRAYPCVFEDMAVRSTNTPLHVAARLGHLDLVKAIMDVKPRCAEKLNRDGSSPVHQAVQHGHVEIVKEILSRNPELYKLRDCHGRTPLHCGAAHGKDVIVEALIEFAVSRSPSNLEDDGLEEVTYRGETALHLAAKNKHKRGFEILMRRLDQPVDPSGEEFDPVRGEDRRSRVLNDLMDREGNTVFQLAHPNDLNKLIRSIFMYYAEGRRWYTFFAFIGLIVSVYLDQRHMVGVLLPPIAIVFLTAFLHQIYLFFSCPRRSVSLSPSAPVNNDLGLSGQRRPASPSSSAPVSNELALNRGRRSVSNMALSRRKRSVSLPLSCPISNDLVLSRGRRSVSLPPSDPISNDLALSRERRSVSPSPNDLALMGQRRSDSPPPSALVSDASPSGSPYRESGNGGFNSIEIASIACASAIVSVLLALIVLFLYTRRWHPRSRIGSTRKEVAIFTDIGVPLTFEIVVRATGNFNASNCIGSGGFGATYKAEISPGFIVAIKRLSVGRFQGVQQLNAEIKTIGRLRHANLVTLIGYHASETEMFLIYNYLPGGNLEKFIQERSTRAVDWRVLHKIALDIARALAYLHDQCVPRILHRDVKPSNILLDKDSNAYLSDFGLARLLGTSETHATTGVAGTFGYVAPEYAMTCRVSDKADVYSYGVVLLELLSDKKALDPSFSSFGNGFNIVAWACMLLRQGRAKEFFTAGLWDAGPHDDLVEVLHLAVVCTVDSLSTRPTMRQVVRRLKQLQPPSF